MVRYGADGGNLLGNWDILFCLGQRLYRNIQLEFTGFILKTCASHFMWNGV